jgi:hypothetical protein
VNLVAQAARLHGRIGVDQLFHFVDRNAGFEEEQAAQIAVVLERTRQQQLADLRHVRMLPMWPSWILLLSASGIFGRLGARYRNTMT